MFLVCEVVIKLTQITVVACCNASGSVIPPLVVFDRKFLKPEYTHGEVPGTAYALSDSGWINAKTFDDWFHNHFLCYAPPVRPILLMLDGHSSHYNPSVIEAAAEEGVIIFCLPPHTTYLTQPLDKGCFAPLKSYWREECQTYLSKNKCRAIIYPFPVFSGIFKSLGSCYDNNKCYGRISNNWGMSFDRNAVKSKTPLNPAEVFDPSMLPKETGIKFLPLYSPLVGTRPKERHELKKEDTTSQCKKFVDQHIGKDVVYAQEGKEGSQDGDQDLEFTDAELNLFECRFQEGYNLNHDEQYNEWVRRFHSSLAGPCSVSTPDQSSREPDIDCDDWSRIVQISPPIDSLDLTDVYYLRKITVVDRLLDNRSKEFKLPKLKTKSHHVF